MNKNNPALGQNLKATRKIFSWVKPYLPGVVASALLLFSSKTASAALITLMSSDAANTTSFTGSTNWSNGQAPSAANDYFVPQSVSNPTVDYIIRTPVSSAVTFAGNSLTVQGYVAFKGTNLVTVNDLRLTNGLIGNYSTGGSPMIGRIAGNINIITNGVFYAGGSSTLLMQIFSTITGSGGLEIREPSTVILSGTNTYNGPVTLTGSTLELDATGSMTPSSLTLQNFTSGTNRFPNSTNLVLAGGRLNVGNGPSGVLRVGYHTVASPSTNCVGVLNVSTQPQFTVNVGEFSVGYNTTSTSNLFAAGFVFMATNNTVTATNVFIGDNAVSASSGATSSILLGSGSNYFNTPVLQVSDRKENGVLTLPTNGYFQLDNGASRTAFTVGGENVSTSVSPIGTADFSGGTFVASLGTLTLGLKTGGGAGGDTGTMTMSSSVSNSVNVNSVTIGSMSGATSGTPVAQGTLTFGGGSFLVNNDVTLASFDNASGSAVGILNVNGGTFSVAGNIVNGGGTSTLNVNGVVDMQPAGDVTPGTVSVSVLSGSGTIANASSVAVHTSVTPGGTNTAGTLTVGSLDLSSGAALNYNLSSATDIGNGINDLLIVDGNLILNNNTITVTALSPISTGTYRLITYTGTLSGNLSLNLVHPTTRQTFALDLSNPGQVNLVVTGNPINLLWSGDGAANVWDAGSTANWDGGADVFFGGDYVTFDDSGSSVPDINVAVPVQPGSMTINNTAKTYVFDGSPISTPGALIKQGSGLAALANDNNAFSGPISIQAGTLAIGNGGSTGSLGAGAITNNGLLQVNKSSGGTSLTSQISGFGSLDVTGGGATLSLGGSNSYTGTTTIESGCQLGVVNNFALGSTNGGTIVQSGGSLRFTTLGNWTVGEPLQLNGIGLATNAGALYANTVNNNVTLTGPVTIASPSQIRLVNNTVHMTLSNTVIGVQETLQLSPQDTGSTMTFQNTLALGNDPVLAALTKDGVGTVVLAGRTNQAGSTTINAGNLTITTTNTPQIGDVTVNSGTLQIGSGTNDGALPNGMFNLNGTTTKLFIDASNTFNLNAPITGSGVLSVQNFAKLIVNSTNTFSGNITTGSGVPVTGGIISLLNSFGLGDGSAVKTVTLIHAGVQLQNNLDIPSAISFVTSGGLLSSDIAAGLIPIQSLSGSNTIEGNITLGTGDGDSEIMVSTNSLLTLNGLITANTTGRTLYLGGAGNGIINGYLYDNSTNIPALIKQDSGTWTLAAITAYSGKTTIQGGKLVLGASATIPTTPMIQILSNAVFDVSAVSGGFTLGGSQTLSGNGAVIGNVSATGTISPGAPIGTLNFSNSLVLSGVTLMELNRTNSQNADLLHASSLTFGGTLTVTNIGDPLQAGDTFTLFSGSINSQFATTNLPALSATNLFWDTSRLNSQGILAVGSSTATSPTILPPTVSGSSLILQVNSQSGYNYVLQGTPQLNPSSWTTLQTKAGGGLLTFSIPISPVPNTNQFFRIQVQ